MLNQVIIREHIKGHICIEMPKSEAKKYLLALEEAAGNDPVNGSSMKPRWSHLMKALRARVG